MKKEINKPELLAPAGNWTMLTTAVNNGADAVYLGVENLNMRAKSKNFKVDELEEIVSFCSTHNVDVHLTVNTIVYENELDELDILIKKAKECGVKYVIGWDMAVINACKKYEIPFCISTQASISNSSAAKFYKDLGAERIVLARELSLEQIKEIKQKVDIEIETFIHGAMCVAVSGRCFMSHELFNKSANRGECIQPCRREYEVIDTDSGNKLILGSDYIMSPKDLNTLEFIDQLIEAGIGSFKIEGRKRSPEYAAKVISAYRKAIDLYFEGNLTKDVKIKMIEELGEVYNRGFSHGFYFDEPGAEDFAEEYGSVATTKKVYAGKVLNYYSKNQIVHVKLEAENLSLGDKIYIMGNSSGLIELELKSLVKDEKEILEAVKGDEITFKCSSKVRPRDQVYKVVSR
jgi:putative protease